MTYIGCAVGGDHPADGGRVEAILIPVDAMFDTYIRMQLCEKHKTDDGALPPGDYHVIMQRGLKHDT